MDNVRAAESGWERELLDALERVPMAMPSKAASDLCDVLERMLKRHGDGAQRLQVLASVQRLAQPLLDGLYRQIMAESHPLPVSKADLARRVLKMRSLQARNTCMAVWELAADNGKMPLFGRGRVVRSINEALLLTRDVLELSYLQYREPPHGTWLRLHALYGFANEGGIAMRGCELADEPGKASARQRYAQSLLLALGNPWGLQRSELVQAVAISRALADAVRFDAGQGGIAVHASGADSGPGNPAPDSKAAADVTMIDPAPAWELLDQQLSWAAADAQLISIGDGLGGQIEARRNMLARMSQAWRGQSRRGHDRVGARHVMTVLAGMSAVHQAMAGGEDFDAFRERVAGGDVAASVAGNAAAWLSGHAVSAPVHVETRVLDQSPGGYRLLWPEGHGRRVRIGELVGLMPGSVESNRDQDDNSLLMLGVLRWLRSAEPGQLAVGVELLSRQPRPALVRVLDGGSRRGPIARGLLLDTADAGVELIVAQLRDRQVSGVEVSVPPDEGAPESRSMRRKKFAISHVHELSPAYYRVSLSGQEPENSQLPAS